MNTRTWTHNVQTITLLYPRRSLIMSEQRVAVITGGASGIGRQVSLKFARKGDRVVVADYNEAAGQETVDMIKKKAAKPLSFKSMFPNKKASRRLWIKRLSFTAALMSCTTMRVLAGWTGSRAKYGSLPSHHQRESARGGLRYYSGRQKDERAWH